MTAKRKPTLNQLFKAWLQYQKKSSEVYKLKWDIEKMAAQMPGSTELIVHEGTVYRISTTKSYAGTAKYDVEKIAEADEIKAIQ